MPKNIDLKLTILNQEKNMNFKSLIAAIFAFSFGGANATLVDQGNGLLYDSQFKIYWTQNAGLPGSTGVFNGTGPNTAGEFVSNLNYAGLTGWRIPTLAELTSMYYNDLGGILGGDKTGNQVAIGGANVYNIQGVYWSSDSPIPYVNYVLYFHQGMGGEVRGSFPNPLNVWAVKDVVASNVPEPESLALVGIALVGLIATKRRRNKQVGPWRKAPSLDRARHAGEAGALEPAP